MGNLWGDIFKTFHLYNGQSLIFILLVIAIIYLWITEKEKSKKMSLVYVSVGILAVFFCPLTEYVLVTAVGDAETYYRFLWLTPTYIVIAYAIMKLMIAQKDFIRKTVIMMAACLFIISNGTYVYDNDYFYETENIYQLPQIVVDVCEAMTLEGKDVRAVVPRELLQFIRQYSPYVHLPYGREILVERWNNSDDLHDAMEAEVIEVELLTRLARERECHYIVINAGKVDSEMFEAYNFVLHDVVIGYDTYPTYNIYLDSEADLTPQY